MVSQEKPGDNKLCIVVEPCFVLVLLLIIWPTAAQVTARSELLQKEGVIFEAIGKIQVDNDQWTFIRPVALTPLLQGSQYLHQQLAALQTNLTSHQLGTTAGELATLEDKINRLDEKLQQALILISPPRNKRGMIDAAGYALRWLTGTATVDDVNQVSNKAEKLKQAQIQMEHHLLDQLSILNATTITTEENQRKLEKITTAMEMMAQTVDELTTMGLQANLMNSVFHALTAAIHTLELCTMSTMSELTQFLEAFELLYTNHISSYFLPPRELIHILRDLQKQLPQNLDLPFDLSTTGIYQFYQLATTKAALAPNQQLLLLITFPLRNEQAIFDLHRLQEAPIPAHAETFKYLQITEPYFAITGNHREYMLLTRAEMAACKPMDSDVQVCPTRQTRSIREPSCAAALFLDNAEKAEKLCQFHIAAAPLFIVTPLKERNSWFYFVSESTKIDWSCPNTIKLSTLPQFLQKTGTLHVHPRCTAEIQGHILHGMYTGTQEVRLSTTLKIFPTLQPLLHKQLFDHLQDSNATSQLIHTILTHPDETAKTLKAKIKLNNMDTEIRRTIKNLESEKALSTHAIALYSTTGISLGLALCLLILAWYLRARIVSIARKWKPRKTATRSNSVILAEKRQEGRLRRAQSADPLFDLPLNRLRQARSVSFDYEPPRVMDRENSRLPTPPPVLQEEKSFLDRTLIPSNV